MREHLRALVWPRQSEKYPSEATDSDGKTIYRYTIVGMLVTDRPLDVPNEFMVDGSAGGLSYTLEALLKYAPSYPPGDAISTKSAGRQHTACIHDGHDDRHDPLDPWVPTTPRRAIVNVAPMRYHARMQSLAYGIFTWSPHERVSNRYGSFFLAPEPYSGGPKVTPRFDTTIGKSLEGKRVRVRALIKEARKSRHVGDLFLKIYPSLPAVGEVVDLGVATLEIDWTGKLSDGVPAVMLRPGDPRDELWIDPRKLYRLHSQTVEVLIEETEDAFTPAVVLAN